MGKTWVFSSMSAGNVSAVYLKTCRLVSISTRGLVKFNIRSHWVGGMFSPILVLHL